jgi:hypothetical protein
MTWKNERVVHIGGDPWAWTIGGWPEDGGPPVRVRSPAGEVHEIAYQDLKSGAAAFPEDERPENPAHGVKPGEVADFISRMIIGEKGPDHERYDIIGDVHGCFGELMDLMDRLGHRWNGRRGIHQPAGGRRIAFVGDMADRGPRSVSALMYARFMAEAGHAVWVKGNHDDKLERWAKGNKVTLSHGLAKTAHEFERAGLSKHNLSEFLKTLPLYAFLDHGRLIIAHGGWREGLEKENPGRLRAWCLYGPTTGRTLPNGLPERIDWAAQRRAYPASPMIVYGHQPHEEVRSINRTMCVDTGCCFGGKMTALRWPEMEVVQVDAFDVWDREGRKLTGFGEQNEREESHDTERTNH